VKTKTIFCALTTLALGLSGVAFAQGQDTSDHEHDRETQMQRGSGQGRGAQRGDARNYGQQSQRRDQQPQGQSRVGDERGAGPDHNFHRGGRLPNEYRNRQYVVDDWREHHLSAPPRGYHWVQTGADYVLVAIATGVIAQLLLGQ
jgi:Ni/Co efflux regulator RcnB